MSFRRYIENHYVAACKIQRDIDDKHDADIVSKLLDGSYDTKLVISWMTNYRLFQGRSGKDRKNIAQRFLEFMESHNRLDDELTEDQIEALYRTLLTKLSDTKLSDKKKRGWISATSKLLWCLYPYKVVIYDSFVHRALTVLQCVDNDLDGFQRIGAQPRSSQEDYIELAVHHYMNYQSMVRKLLSVHSQLLQDLREQHQETYLYDVRIMDKLLWMIGNYSKAF